LVMLDAAGYRGARSGRGTSSGSPPMTWCRLII
jgi:hypothetical protein